MSKIGPIPYGKQEISKEDISSVIEVLKSDYLTQGPKIKEFELEFAKYIGSKYAVAVSNGTAALHLSVKALGISPGDKVITTPITFAATANSVLYEGGDIEFVDIDSNTFLMDLNQLEDKLKRGRFRGVIPVDFTGLSVDMEEIQVLSEKYGFWILEDACHAPGGSFTNSSGTSINCGSGVYTDAAIFSFHPVKHIAAGEGGMVTTNSKEIADKISLLRTHGITKDPLQMSESHGGWFYEMNELGYNYRISDIQASLGISQLNKADEKLELRRDIAGRYIIELGLIEDIILQQVNPIQIKEEHAWHLFVIQTKQRKELYDYLKGNNIFCQVHYIPVHKLPYYVSRYGKITFPNAESYYNKALSIPMYPSLTFEEQEYVIESVLEFYGN